MDGGLPEAGCRVGGHGPRGVRTVARGAEACLTGCVVRPLTGRFVVWLCGAFTFRSHGDLHRRRVALPLLAASDGGAGPATGPRVGPGQASKACCSGSMRELSKLPLEDRMLFDAKDCLQLIGTTELLDAHEEAVQQPNNDGNLPLHLAVGRLLEGSCRVEAIGSEPRNR